MNSLLIRISPAAGSLPAVITETTYMTGKGGGGEGKVMGRWRIHMTVKILQCVKCDRGELKGSGQGRSPEKKLQELCNRQKKKVPSQFLPNFFSF